MTQQEGMGRQHFMKQLKKRGRGLRNKSRMHRQGGDNLSENIARGIF
jgi:hypothetical protein